MDCGDYGVVRLRRHVVNAGREEVEAKMKKKMAKCNMVELRSMPSKIPRVSMFTLKAMNTSSKCIIDYRSPFFVRP